MEKDEDTALCVRTMAAVVFGVKHMLEETEELTQIFVTSIETAVRQAHGPERSRRAEKKQKQSLKV
jgi:hypothetical protein